MYIPKCFHEQVRKEYLIKKLKEMYKKDNKETQAEQLPQDAVMRCYFPNFKILKKENFYTKEPVEILRISFLGKVWFYHLTFRRFL